MVTEFRTDFEKAVALLATTQHGFKTFSLAQPLSKQMNFPGNPSFTWHITQSEPKWPVLLNRIKEQMGHTTPWNKLLREEYADVTALTEWLLARADSKPVVEFASLMERMPEVHSVRTSYDNGTTHVWTYLDAKPFDSPIRYEVLDAEETIVHRHPGATLDFHLINLSEYPDEVRDSVSLIGEAVYQRQGVGEQSPAPVTSS